MTNQSSRWGLSSLVCLALSCGSDSGAGTNVERPGDGTAGASAAGASTAGGASAAGASTAGGASAGGAAGHTSAAGSSSSSGGVGTSGAGSGGSAVAGCAAAVSQASQIPANLLFVLDRSGSMSCNPPNGRDETELSACQGVTQIPEEDTKWQITSSALADALDQLALQDNVSVGLTLFPMVDGGPQDVRLPEDGPDVPIRLLDGAQRAALVDFVETVEPRGETPLANATLSSYELLRQQITGGDLPGNTFVVLMTDGTETASRSLLQELVDTWVGTAYSGFSIRTFVIGAPGSEQARSTLSRIAYDGRTPSAADCERQEVSPDLGDCHLDMTTSADFRSDLSEALRGISESQALACDFELPSNPSGAGVNLNEVNVTYRPQTGNAVDVLLDDQSDCEVDAEGWQFSSDRSRIVLCGDICDSVRGDLEGQVEIVLGCPTIRRIR